ncbi:MAG TPA: response regulator [Chloroflexota bacterium]
MRRSNSILIVEDNVDMAEIYQETLTAQGYTVKVAQSGKEALESLNVQRPDVVVMDLTLPDMGWSKVLSAARELSRSHEVKLILVSGRHDLADIARDSGAFAHLQKPFDLQELIKLLA